MSSTVENLLITGGAWFSQMLSEALDLPFPRNRLPMATCYLMQCHVLNPADCRQACDSAAAAAAGAGQRTFRFGVDRVGGEDLFLHAGGDLPVRHSGPTP